MKDKFKAIRGLTLIELLVVIGVIAILVALLLPVLSVAKAKAQRTVCINNLREINLGVRMYSDDSNDASPTAAITNGNFVLPLYSGYKALMKNYVGLKGASSPQDKLFACPADVLNPWWIINQRITSPRFVKKSIHDISDFDYSSYAFNGGDNVSRTFTNGNKSTNFTFIGLGNVKLTSVKHPTRTLLVVEYSALWPYSWHDPSSHGVAFMYGTTYNDAKNVASFVDGHVSYIKIYCSGIPSLLTNPPASYDYQWTPD